MNFHGVWADNNLCAYQDQRLRHSAPQPQPSMKINQQTFYKEEIQFVLLGMN